MSAAQRPPQDDDPTQEPLSTRFFRALWRRLWGGPRLRRLRPLSTEAMVHIAERWDEAARRITRIEATTPPLDVSAHRHPSLHRYEKVCASLEANISELRKPLPRDAKTRAPAEGTADGLQRARAQIKAAEELLDAMEESSEKASANAEAWERRAMLAIMADDDGLAREALGYRAEWAGEHRRLQREVDAGRAVLVELRATLASMAPAGDEPEKG